MPRSYGSFFLLLGFWLSTLSLSAQIDSLSRPMSGEEPQGVEAVMAEREAMTDSLLGFRIAPLDTLLARALANSPEILAQEATIRARAATLKVERRKWTKLIQPFVGVNYGTNIVAANIESGNTVNYNFATRQQLLYNVGLNLRLSAEDLINRGQRSQIIEHEIDKLKHDTDVLHRLVRERVITRYEQLMQAAEVLSVAAQQMQTNEINWELAQRYYQSGDMAYADYNGILEGRLNAKIQFINLKSDFQTQYLLLRELVGGPLE
jgi:outer membrane protein TolC